jgi:endoglucanase
MKKKIMALALVGMMAAGMLTGCAGNSSGDSAGSSATAEVTETKEEAEGTAQETAESPAEGSAEESENPMNTEKAPNINPQMESLTAWDVVNDIRIGWNLGNSMDATNNSLTRIDKSWKFETAWGNPVITQEQIDLVLEQGFNAIRIPTSWEQHMDQDGNVQDIWMDRVQEVVDYAYNRGAYVVLNCHHETWNYPYYDNQEAACEMERKLWTQICERFKDYDEHLIFESQNEPRKVGTSLEWTGGDQEGWDVVNAVNAAFLETVRSADGSNPYRVVFMPCYAASSDEKSIKNFKIPEGDDRVIFSVHAYTPYNFALQSPGTDQWDESNKDIDYVLQCVKKHILDNGTPCMIGEFGCVNKNNTETRVKWSKYYVNAAAEIGVPCFWWDNNAFESGESFGLIDRVKLEVRYPEIIEALMEGTESRAEGANE